MCNSRRDRRRDGRGWRDKYVTGGAVPRAGREEQGPAGERFARGDQARDLHLQSAGGRRTHARHR
eukprot:525124-Pyramimonas_sp.AAC.1